MGNLSLIVVGEMNIDVIVSGLPSFPGPGQLVNGERIDFGPGGKSRNIASMAGALLPAGRVAMVSKTARDPYGLWELPIKALQNSGVSSEYIKVLDTTETDKLPGFAVILVDRQGNNQIIGAPGITRDLNEADIDMANSLFQEVGANNGFLVFIGNNRIPLAKYMVQSAKNAGVRVLFDPGGADDVSALAELLDGNIYLFKPNEHEAEALTGVKVIDFESAKAAAAKLIDRGVQNVLITAGARGAYLFYDGQGIHVPAPEVEHGEIQDETGCGDQVMAALGAYMAEGKDLPTATALAILAGTLQFHRLGIQPVRPDDIASYFDSDKERQETSAIFVQK